MSNKKAGDLEQIFTPNKLTDYLIDNFIKDRNITEIIEPTAGSGMMLDRIKERFSGIKTIAFEIDSGQTNGREDIWVENFMDKKLYKKYDLEYKKGRIAIMNPPFSKAIKMMYKCLEICDIVYCIAGQGMFLNLDYEKYVVDDIHYIKKATFADGKSYTINMISLRKKKEVDDVDDFWS